MFEQIMVNKNGAEIKRMASRKKALLQTRLQKLDEQNSDIQSSSFLLQGQKDENIRKNMLIQETINDSIIFCEVIVEHVPDGETFSLSIREVNFLMSQTEYSYK